MDKKNPICLLGVDPATPVLNLPEIEQNINIIKIPNRILFDRNSRPEFGPIAEEFTQGQPVEFEIFPYNGTTGYRVEVGGLFTLGPSFGVDGTLIVNYSTILQVFQERQAGYIDVGLINLKPEAITTKVIDDLSANLPKDIKVFTRKNFIEFEKSYWSLRTPIGFVFSLMLAMGFVVGVVVVYQILYSNISNHLSEYATIKAMGFKNNYFLLVVLQQSLFLAVLGYIPGLIICLGLYDWAKEGTHLPIVMTLDKLLKVFIGISLMCLTSGGLSISKLRSVDPADIF